MKQFESKEFLEGLAQLVNALEEELEDKRHLRYLAKASLSIEDMIKENVLLAKLEGFGDCINRMKVLTKNYMLHKNNVTKPEKS